jgi:hypothetical protein
MPDPVETPKHLYREAARGRDESTPALVLSGVTIVIAAAVAAVLAIALLIYFLA